MMGMFDYVKSEIPLPDGFEGELQSKDFDCAMTIIRIGADGALAIERFENEVVPENERPYPDMPIIGMLRRVNRRWEPLEHHGHFNFYGWEGQPGKPECKWHEYDAKFTDGKLVEIKVIEDTPA